MTYDVDDAQSDLLAAPPAPRSFAFGPEPSRVRGKGWLVMVVAAAAVAAAGVSYGAGAVGGGKDGARPPAPKPAPKHAAPAPTLAATRHAVLSTMKNAATAEGVSRTDTPAYPAAVALLRAGGLDPARGVSVRVVSASRTRFCLRISGALRVVAYYDSKT